MRSCSWSDIEKANRNTLTCVLYVYRSDLLEACIEKEMARISAKLALTKRIIAAGGLLAIAGGALCSSTVSDVGDGSGNGVRYPSLQGVDGRRLRRKMM